MTETAMVAAIELRRGDLIRTLEGEQHTVERVTYETRSVWDETAGDFVDTDVWVVYTDLRPRGDCATSDAKYCKVVRN